MLDNAMERTIYKGDRALITVFFHDKVKRGLVTLEDVWRLKEGLYVVRINNRLAALGMFVFTRQTVPFQNLDRTSNWRHPTNAIVGAMPKTQFTGKESESQSEHRGVIHQCCL